MIVWGITRKIIRTTITTLNVHSQWSFLTILG